MTHLTAYQARTYHDRQGPEATRATGYFPLYTRGTVAAELVHARDAGGLPGDLLGGIETALPLLNALVRPVPARYRVDEPTVGWREHSACLAVSALAGAAVGGLRLAMPRWSGVGVGLLAYAVVMTACQRVQAARQTRLWTASVRPAGGEATARAESTPGGARGPAGADRPAVGPGAPAAGGEAESIEIRCRRGAGVRIAVMACFVGSAGRFRIADEVAGQLFETMGLLASPDDPAQQRAAIRGAFDLGWIHGVRRAAAHLVGRPSLGDIDGRLSLAAVVATPGHVHVVNVGRCGWMAGLAGRAQLSLTAADTNADPLADDASAAASVSVTTLSAAELVGATLLGLSPALAATSWPAPPHRPAPQTTAGLFFYGRKLSVAGVEPCGEGTAELHVAAKNFLHFSSKESDIMVNNTTHNSHYYSSRAADPAEARSGLSSLMSKYEYEKKSENLQRRVLHLDALLKVVQKFCSNRDVQATLAGVLGSVVTFKGLEELRTKLEACPADQLSRFGRDALELLQDDEVVEAVAATGGALSYLAADKWLPEAEERGAPNALRPEPPPPMRG